MNHTLDESPLAQSDVTQQRMDHWVSSQKRGDVIDLEVYGKPSQKQVSELENVRSLSKELQDQLNELERSVRVADVENQALSPTAAMLDFSEHHEFVSADRKMLNQTEEREEEKKRLMKDGRISLKASRVVEKVVL